MAIYYKLYQMKSGNADVKGMWRARVMPQGVVNIDGLAKIMEKNSVSNRIRRYVDVIGAKLHDLNRS